MKIKPLPVLFFIFPLLSGAVGAEEAKRSGTPHNILLITVDTLRTDKLGCYGSQTVKTPNIDALAKRSVVFTRAFAHNPLTLPSHANILLGTTPLYHGIHDNMNFRATGDHLTLAEFLKDRGYRTGAVIGAVPLDSRFGLDQGFDFYEDDFKKRGDPINTPAERRADAVIEIAEEWLAGQDDPWFLWLHVFDPHFPYEAPEPFLSRYKSKPYNGEVAYVDQVLGDFLSRQRDLGRLDETLIVLTSDHGESLGDHGEKTHGMYAYNVTIWVPLIVYVPGGEHRKVEQIVAHVDIFPTICDVEGFDLPEFLQGVSFQPALAGKKLASGRSIYFESLEAYYNFGWAPIRGYITQKEKYIDSPIFEVYDLAADFFESHNRAENVNRKKYQAELNRMMETFSHSDATEARTQHSLRTVEKLRSLGYANTLSSFKTKENYGPKDDMKTLLPLYVKAQDALDLAEKDRMGEAVSRLTQMTENNPRIYQPFVFLSDLHLKSGRAEEATSVLSRGHALFPNNIEILRRLFRRLLEEGRFEEVIEAAGNRIQWEHVRDPRIWVQLARAYLGLKRNHEAVQILEEAVGLDNGYAECYALLGQAEMYLAETSDEDSHYFNALKSLKKAVELDPKLNQAWYHLGLGYIRANSFDEAVEALTNSLKSDAADLRAYFYLGLCYLNLGQKAQSKHYFSFYRDQYLPLLTPDERKDLEVYLRRLDK